MLRLGARLRRAACAAAAAPPDASAACAFHAVAFGNGDHGRLGTGELRSEDAPRRMATPAGVGVLSVACGGAHTLVLLESGEVLACGLNDHGQCGAEPADAAHVATPARVRGLPPDVLAVAAGNFHSLAVTADGAVYAWGRNDSGQCGLGDGALASAVAAPRRVPHLGDVSSVAAGAAHSLAVTLGGALFAWGLRSRLGLGRAERWRLAGGAHVEAAPRLVRALQGVAVAAAAAGHTHSLCVDGAGAAYAWGDGGYWQTGTGSDLHADAPVRLDVGLEGAKIDAAAAGGMHSLAVSAGGALFAWGANAHGALGVGGATAAKGGEAPTRRPARVGEEAGLEVARVAAGWKHSAAVTPAGALLTWGWGGSSGSHAGDAGASSGGQLGLGSECDFWAPTAVPGYEARVLHVSAGFNHTAAVVSERPAHT